MTSRCLFPIADWLTQHTGLLEALQPVTSWRRNITWHAHILGLAASLTDWRTSVMFDGFALHRFTWIKYIHRRRRRRHVDYYGCASLHFGYKCIDSIIFSPSDRFWSTHILRHRTGLPSLSLSTVSAGFFYPYVGALWAEFDLCMGYWSIWRKF